MSVDDALSPSESPRTRTVLSWLDPTGLNLGSPYSKKSSLQTESAVPNAQFSILTDSKFFSEASPDDLDERHLVNSVCLEIRREGLGDLSFVGFPGEETDK